MAPGAAVDGDSRLIAINGYDEVGGRMMRLTDIEEARRRIADRIYQSPCAYSETISRRTGKRVFFKLENLQITGSFKERGALNRLLTLTPEEKQRGVITASAGNHGMAVAFHTRTLG